MFCKKHVLEKFIKIHRKTPVPVSFFNKEHLWTTASVYRDIKSETYTYKICLFHIPTLQQSYFHRGNFTESWSVFSFEEFSPRAIFSFFFFFFFENFLAIYYDPINTLQVYNKIKSTKIERLKEKMNKEWKKHHKQVQVNKKTRQNKQKNRKANNQGNRETM